MTTHQSRLSEQLQTSCRCQKHYLECDGYGSIPAKFMFVGLSAGKLGALITRVPFTKDGSGRLLQRTLGTLGYSKSDEFSIKPELQDVYITNLAKGRYLDEKGNNRLPTSEEIYDWFPYLENEIQKAKPIAIIALGQLVYDSLKDNYPNLIQAKHPRWYFSHGAVNAKGKWSQIMVDDYRKILA
ncbi:MAG: uracil-DNA glycosylase family protein [Thaumarchaeota archaeon]|nr:uracil-DNA glycosylase family protein [Nitrososphaerota archaeon]